MAVAAASAAAATTTSADSNSYILPTIEEEGSWQLWLCGVAYWSIAAVGGVGFALAVRTGSPYFRASFLGVSAVFCLLRGLLVTVHFARWQNHMFWLYLVAYFTPIYLQFVTFSLLILFVVRCLFILHEREGVVDRRLYPGYRALLIVLFCVSVLVSWLLARSWDAKADLSTWDEQPALYTALLFGALALSGAVAAFRSYRLLLLAGATGTLRAYVVLIPIYVVIFSLRCAWGLLYYAGENPLQDRVSSYISKGRRGDFENAYLAFYLAFEIVPTALVVCIFSGGAVSRKLRGDGDTAAVTPHAVSPLMGGGGGGGGGVYGTGGAEPEGLYGSTGTSAAASGGGVVGGGGGGAGSASPGGIIVDSGYVGVAYTALPPSSSSPSPGSARRGKRRSRGVRSPAPAPGGSPSDPVFVPASRGGSGGGGAAVSPAAAPRNAQRYAESRWNADALEPLSGGSSVDGVVTPSRQSV